MNYQVIRSKRKTASIQIKPSGEIIIRIPEWYTKQMIDELTERHSKWIMKKLQELQMNGEQVPIKLSEHERADGIHKARQVFPERVSHYAEVMGVTYARITVREQKTRWGSCSSKGNLNFNWKLVLTPDYVLDYVVIHELAHRKVMDHSKQFYAVVAEVMPDYERARIWLRKNGRSII